MDGNIVLMNQGRSRRCLTCDLQQREAWHEANIEKVRASSRVWYRTHREAELVKKKLRYIARKAAGKRNSTYNPSTRRKRIYGLTDSEYVIMLSNQGGHCATCPETERLVIDHNHRTNEVRGILCDSCNTVLGRVHESRDTLAAMQWYVITKGCAYV